jgi:hypothetical protein
MIELSDGRGPAIDSVSPYGKELGVSTIRDNQGDVEHTEKTPSHRDTSCPYVVSEVIPSVSRA